MATKIRVRRGLLADLPSLDTGEFGLATDSNDLYIGTDTGNELLAHSADVAVLAALVGQHWTDSSEQRQSLRNACDGYVTVPNIAATGDGYLAFFTGVGRNVAGDNDLYWDRVNNRLFVGTTGYLKNDNNLVISTTGGSADLSFGTQDTERFVIDQGGTGTFWGGFGVGTGPDAKFCVATNEASNYVAKFTNDGNADNRYGIQISAGAYDGVTGNTPFIDFFSGNTTVKVGHINNSNGSLTIGTNSIDRIYIDQAGDVSFTGSVSIGGDITNKDLNQNLQTLRQACDGYTTSTGSTSDGYIAFFTGTNKIAGDNDLYWDRVINRLRLASIYTTGNNLLLAPSTGKVKITADGAANHGFVLDGITTHDTLVLRNAADSAAANISVDAVLASNGFYSTASNKALRPSSGADNAGAHFIPYSATQTPDTGLIATGSDGNSLLLCEFGDTSYDWALAQQTNPTLAIMGPTQQVNSGLLLSYNDTAGVIATRAGNINLIPASGVVSITNDISIGGDIINKDLTQAFQSIRQACDGYITSSAGSLTITSDLSVGGDIINKDLHQTIQTIRQACDGYAAGSTTSTGPTGDGYLTFFTGTNKIASDNDLFWDRENNRLGIHNQTPSAALDVVGGIAFNNLIFVPDVNPSRNDYAAVGYILGASANPAADAGHSIGADLIIGAGFGAKSFAANSNLAGNTTVTITANGASASFTSGAEFTLGTDDTPAQLEITSGELYNAINSSGSSILQYITTQLYDEFVYIRPKETCYQFDISSTNTSCVWVYDYADGKVSIKSELEVTENITAKKNLSIGGNILNKDLTQALQSILQACDGYGTIPPGGVSSAQGADGYLAFFTGPGAIAGDNDLFWDRENNRLGIGTSAPQHPLHVTNSSYACRLDRILPGITNQWGTALRICGITDSDMDDGFGVGITFRLQDNTSSLGTVAAISGQRDGGADDSGKLVFETWKTGAETVRMTVDSIGQVIIGNNTADNARLCLDSVAGSYRGIEMWSAGNSRWLTCADATAESGNNAGSNLSIYTYSDDGETVSKVFTITRADGYVGIGTDSPTAPIDVRRNILNGYAAQFWNNGGTTNHNGIEIRCGDASGSTDGIFIVCHDYHGTEVGYIQNSGGNFNLADSSDARIKKDIAPTKVAGLETINGIELFEFTKINSNSYHPIGFIAQQLKEKVPEAVSESRDGILMVSKEAMIPYLCKSVQELSAQIEELKKEIEILKSK